MGVAAALGYGIASLAFLLLAVLLALGWEGRRRGLRLILAAGLMAIWCGALTAFASWDLAPSGLMFIGETLTTTAWLMVLAALLGNAGFPRALALTVHLAWIGALAAGIFVLLAMPDFTADVVMTSGLGLGLLGLVLLEQLYRNSNASGRWAMRYLYLGVGGLFIYDLFLYSQGLLLGGISADIWAARGFVMALTVPFIAIAARRNPEWSLQVFVSRDIVFYATSVFSVGVYLLLTAAGGYLVQLFGGSWGALGQIVFFAAALGLLGVLVGSTALRKKLRVFLVKHFYRNKYDYREEWLRFIQTLSNDAAGETPPVTSVRAVAQIIGSPRAALLLCGDRPGRWEVEAVWPVGAEPPGESSQRMADDSLQAFLESEQWVVDLLEHEANPQQQETLKLPAWISASHSWRLIVPVLLGDRLLGMLLLANPPDGFELTFEDRDLLKTVARHIATHLSQYKAEERLAEDRQFAAYSKLASFVMHDLKNATAQLELVVVNAQRHKDNPEFVDDAIETVAGTVRRISQLIAQLQEGERDGSSSVLDLRQVLAAALDRVRSKDPVPSLQVEGAALSAVAHRERLVAVLEHLIRNAQDAATVAGKVIVTVRRNGGDHVVVEICDNGPGMNSEFVRDRLFKPFDSTKGSRGMGIGAYQAREYIRSIAGWLEVESTPGRGTTVRVLIPGAA